MLPSRPKAVLISLACLLSLICPAFIHPDPRPVPAEAEGIPDHSSRLRPLCHLLSRRRPALRQGAAYTAIFLGAAHRSAVFSGPPCRVRPAAPRSDAGAYPNAPGSGLLRGRRHGRRNFKLTRKRMCLGTFSRRGAVASATIYLCPSAHPCGALFCFIGPISYETKRGCRKSGSVTCRNSLLHPLLFRCFIRAPLFFPVLHPPFLPDGGSA